MDVSAVFGFVPYLPQQAAQLGGVSTRPVLGATAHEGEDGVAPTERARHDRITARNRVEPENFGDDFAFGLRWVCGLDEPARRSRDRTR